MKLRTIFLAVIASISLQHSLAQSSSITNRQVLKSNDISFEDILFWVGEGSNQSIFIVNWCSPEIAFAWGYRFSEDSVLVSKIIEDIAAADSRIVFTDGGGYITNITYKDSVYNLGLSGDFWMYNVNEGWATGIGLQYIHNEDIVEFGDESCGISDTNWIYVWDIVITPVSKPNDVAVQNVKLDNMHIAIYPNPTSQNINLNIQNVKEDVRVDIVDINGKILYSEKIAVDNQLLQSISLEKFSKGLYFIRFQGSSFNKTEKIIIY